MTDDSDPDCPKDERPLLDAGRVTFKALRALENGETTVEELLADEANRRGEPAPTAEDAQEFEANLEAKKDGCAQRSRIR